MGRAVSKSPKKTSARTRAPKNNNRERSTKVVVDRVSQAAIESYNRFIAENGLWAEEYRDW
jgi:hypothetical protein